MALKIVVLLFFYFFCHLVHNLCSYTVWILCATERATKSGTNSKVQARFKSQRDYSFLTTSESD